jgi:UDP-4-amino-4,6-dideoxy-N-acetyl-beta-L-altrosamine N-acetyltransferase
MRSPDAAALSALDPARPEIAAVALAKLGVDARESSGADGLLFGILAARAGLPRTAAEMLERIGLTHRSGAALSRAASLWADAAVAERDPSLSLRSYITAQVAADAGEVVDDLLARLSNGIGWRSPARPESAAGSVALEMKGAPVGLANLARIDLAARRCEWAYYLADASTRGRGLGSQIEYIVLRHVFETRGLNKLWCEVLLDNEAVWKLHESFGFVREALYRQHVFKDGRFQDVVGLGMLASDWAAARPAIEARLGAKGIVAGALPAAP